MLNVKSETLGHSINCWKYNFLIINFYLFHAIFLICIYTCIRTTIFVLYIWYIITYCARSKEVIGHTGLSTDSLATLNKQLQRRRKENYTSRSPDPKTLFGVKTLVSLVLINQSSWRKINMDVKSSIRTKEKIKRYV